MRLTLTLVIVLSNIGRLYAAEELASVLKHPIVPEGETGREHTQFVTQRIPKLKLAESAAAWQQEADRLRTAILNDVVFHGVPDAWREGQPRVERFGTIDSGNGYTITKLRYEALPGLWIPALLYEPENLTGKVPVVLNVNGHDPNGKACDYKQLRCINLAKRGIIALNTEWLGMGELRTPGYAHNDLALLDLCGTSGLSVFYLAMSRGLDFLLAHEHADLERLAMTGLSGGGWQTILLSSLDTRIKVSIPVAGYSSLVQRVVNRSSIGDLEQNPSDLISLGDYVHLTALLAPRPALLIYNATDNCCFKSATVRPNTYEPVIPFYEQAGVGERFEYYENSDPGTHNYELDNRQQLYRFLNKHFQLSDGSSDEIPSGDEVQTADALKIGVPGNNATFRSLATQLAQRLPREPEGDLAQNRKLLMQTLRLPPTKVTGQRQGDSISVENLTVERYRLNHDSNWTLPLVIVTPQKVNETVLFIADDGFASQFEAVNKLVTGGARVVCLDPLFIGQANPPGGLYQNAQLVATVGARPLGIQASQILGTLEFLNSQEKLRDIKLVTVGIRSSLAGLCAGALDDRHFISKGNFDGLPESLKHLLREGQSYSRTPEVYCFGLLKHFDIPQLQAMASHQD